MLKLQNVSKTYVTKSKTETQALKDVNLEIAGRGMVFVLGKSGSGKSTLLNLLGGLDSPTSGEILVDGVSMKQFSQRDYASYRNNYVGFVFQEFNLLADFNVRDNVALALKLSKDSNVDAKVSDALSKVELNDSYLTRRIDEMSGGEKQRIAIARAIIKESKLILADEPTGNLDSATGESIWNILKGLSRDRLVVVVSHDRESAEKYADRIIEIADGQIIADKGAQPTVEADAQPVTSAQSRLSFATRLKMGYNNLKLRKVKTASVILVAVFSILCLIITQVCLCFSPEVALANYIKRNNIDYFTVDQGAYVEHPHRFGTLNHQVLKRSSKDYIADNSNYIKDGVVQSKQNILDFGLTFVGEALELDNDSFYAVSTAIEGSYESGHGLVEIDGEYVEMVKEFHPVEYLIGKKVKLNYDGNDAEGILAGVIDAERLVNASALPNFFYNINFNSNWRFIPTFNEGRKHELTVQFGNNQYDDTFTVNSSIRLLEEHNAILTADGLWTKSNQVQLAYDEVVLPYIIYAELFGAKSQGYYISSDLNEVRNVPQELGSTFELKFYEYATGELLVDYGKVKLAGIYFGSSDNTKADRTLLQITCSNKFCQQFSYDIISTPILIQTSSVKNITKFVTTLRRDSLMWIENAGYMDLTEPNGQGKYFESLSEIAYGFDDILKVLSIGFLVIGGLLTIVFVLLIINLISFSITNRKREIGILSAIGASNKDVNSIFLLETLIISGISFVITLALSFASISLINLVISKTYYLCGTFPFLSVDILAVITLAATAFALPLLATLIPLSKIIKLKPIDAIRNI